MTPRPIRLTPGDRAVLQVFSRKSTARQGHGFSFEGAIQALLDLETDTNPTSRFDGFRCAKDVVEYISVKHIGAKNALELSDYERNARRTESITMYLGRWSVRGGQRVTTEIYVMTIPAEEWRTYFPDDDRVDHFTKSTVFAGISNDRRDDKAWKSRTSMLKRAWRQQLPLTPIDIRFKRDHGNQRRVQCAVPFRNFPSVFARFYDEVKTVELEALLRELAD